MKRVLTLATLALTLALGAGHTLGATAQNLHIVSASGDQFWNYDFLSTQCCPPPNNVDWAFDLIFWNNATINKVKNGLENPYDQGGLCASGMNARLNDGTGWVWDSDSGKKTTCCPVTGSAYHFRVYADSDDRLYSTLFGYYVLGSTHIDHAECGSGSWFGYSEDAEAYLRQHVPSGWTVNANSYNLENNEPLRAEGNHIWQNNGYASKIRVP